MASPTPNIGMTYPVRGGSVGTWDTPLDTNFDTLDLVLGGTVAVAAAGTGATLTQTQANNRRISITGVLTQNYLMSFPAIGGLWVVINNTTGSFTVTLNVTGSGVTVLAVNQGETALVSSDGTDLFVGTTQGNTWAGATYAGTDVSPTSFSTDQNNYNPTSLSTATCLRLNATAACSITGLAGGAASRDLELVSIGTATIKFPANSGSSTAANRFANTFNLFPGQTIFLRYDATSSLWRPKNVATAFSSCALAGVSPDLLITNTVTPNTVLNITASEAVLVDASGNGIKFETISVAVDSTTNGPGGCALGTRAAGAAYFVWLVSDGVSINAVVDTSATQATVLANLTTSGFPNYIYMKRIGSQFTNGSSNFLRVRQSYRRAQYVVSSATTTAYPTLGTTSGTGWTAFAVAGFVPTTAVSIAVCGGNHTNNAACALSPNNLESTTSFIVNPPPIAGYSSTGSFVHISGTLLLESTNIYGNAQAGTMTVFCVGWDDSI